MRTLDEAIKHCEEVAEEQEDFDKFKCGYCKPGCEDGVWKETCRLPSNIPVGCSWGECSEQNCPLFPGNFECASEHRQLAEWLKELKTLRERVEDLEDQLEYKSRVMDKLSWDEVIEAENEVDAEMAADENEEDVEKVEKIYDKR